MRAIASVALLILAFVATSLTAEVPPLGPERRKELASHIVTGTVVRVYSVEEDKGKGFVDTLYVIEVSVGVVAKGDGIEKGQSIFVKAWRAGKRPDGWVGPSGQHSIPTAGLDVNVFMTREKGTFTALNPNGIEVFKTGG